MISIIPSSERFGIGHGWLKSFHHFSFDTYCDQKNMNWGILRVFNDDFIAPGGKFGMHPHANYEIITIVLEGEISHQDSTGAKGTIHTNEVQAMTAGSGILHSEENTGKKMLHSLQIWITPEKLGLKPTYSQATFSEKGFSNRMCQLVSGKTKSGAKEKAPLHISAPASIFRCRLSKGKKINYELDGEFGYVFVVSGKLELNGIELSEADSAKIKKEKKLEFSAEKDGADFILFEL